MPPNGRAVKAILAAYVITFAILSLGMLANAGKGFGSYMPDATGGIAILAVSLVVAFAASLFWVASRRLFAIGAAVILGLTGAGSLGSGITGLAMIALAVGIGVVAVRTSSAPGAPTTTTLGVLLVVPVLLLLVVGGICVASGLPIPRAG
jgi:hypothetical protein